MKKHVDSHTRTLKDGRVTRVSAHTRSLPDSQESDFTNSQQIKQRLTAPHSPSLASIVNQEYPDQDILTCSRENIDQIIQNIGMDEYANLYVYAGENSAQVAGLISYYIAAAGKMRGDGVYPSSPDEHGGVWIYVDLTKSRSDDYGISMDVYQSENSIQDLLTEGSPVRKTNRAGAGTKGTRAVEGIGDMDFQVILIDPQV